MDHFITMWNQKTWERRLQDARFGERELDYAASNRFITRGMKRGDVLYIVGYHEQVWRLGGRIEIADIVDRVAAQRLLQRRDLWQGSDYAIARSDRLCRFQTHLKISTDILEKLRFLTGSDTSLQIKKLVFKTNGVDPQSFRQIRWLTEDSADLLDTLLAAHTTSLSLA